MVSMGPGNQGQKKVQKVMQSHLAKQPWTWTAATLYTVAIGAVVRGRIGLKAAHRSVIKLLPLLLG